ncbi:DNA polymerase III subunit gamma/tau [Brachybacterium ginsengisoli]|uniref:DNA-directed DNA polymerase n=1 Tax=Brachybacterium ginsengisoli TaxID=1331682 RepID=A0A291GU16_9MICO|nr:DNA polymerase III subunit gamma and tau [Brachybacterium ginsengisoli]ATG53711.1 DNA polymerase III subunit gamma/tau [Brachybacterium ginsengisoli]
MATALYRRYRPESFAEVIGQDHVTTPLRRALRAGRIGHAYLFSGPRGCGKTTSARILARCLNCAEGPTDIPCGQCDSCRDLANGGSGSLDVVEIDAASHGGVDDARELRERASFAPVRDRYKVFIIDEAHMVTSAGFNALLKLVEEPPEHVKFVFATTEPDKVIGTIRSRTHHYPFRLIPPQVLGPYLEEVCAAEQVQVGEGVMPLVVRAGGGSARDSMSVLDQLMAGAGDDGLDFPTAIALLGFTDTALLDSAVTAVAERDAASLYSAVEHVLATGHEPRRFVEDLLERMRDLIVLAAVPDRGADLLPQVPAGELESMRVQAGLFAPADLSQCGDLVHETLSTMSGATSPRLHLELLAARLVLRDERAALAAADGPASAPDQRGGAQPVRGGQPAQAPSQSSGAGASGAREEARRIAQEKVEAARQARGGRPAAAPVAQEEQPARQERAPWGDAVQQSAPPRPAAQDPAASAPQNDPTQQPADQTSGQRVPAQQAAAQQSPDTSAEPQAATPPQTMTQGSAAAARSQGSSQDAPAQPAPAAQPAQGGGLDADQVRTHWSAILDELQQIRRPSWALISQNGHVNGAHDSTLVIGFRTDGLVSAFHRGTAAQNLADAVRRIMHLDVTIEAVVGEDPGPGGGRGAGPAGGGSAGGGSAGGGPAGGGPAVGGSSAGGSSGGGPMSGGPAGGGPVPTGGATAPVAGAAAGGPAPTGTPASEQVDPAPASKPRWGDAVSAVPVRETAPAPQEPEQVSAGQRASERAMQAAARAAQSGGRPGPGAAPDRVEDFPPEPDDPFPPDPQDDYQPRYRTPQQDAAAPVTASAPVPTPARDETPGGSRWSDALQDDSSPAPARDVDVQGAAPSAAATAPAPGGGTPVVDDEGRDSLPPEDPRTYGQNALRRAIAEGRVVHSRPAQNAAGAASAGADSAGEQPEGVTPGDVDQGGQEFDSGRPALQAMPPMSSGSAASAPSADTPGAGATSWTRSEPAEDASAAPATGVEGSASARAAASWGTTATTPPASGTSWSSSAASAATVPSASSSATSAPSASAPSAADSAADSAAPRSGAALVREAALASRTAAGQRGANRRGGAAEPVADTDPTGGATRDDEDAVVATRNGREVVEKLLGGKVLEVIDENRNY